MLIPPGVLVPLDDVQVVLDALALALRTGRAPLTPGVVQLVSDLEVAATRADTRPDGNGSLPAGGAWVTVSAMARIAGVQPRAIRARLTRGSLPGRKVNGRWLIEEHA